MRVFVKVGLKFYEEDARKGDKEKYIQMIDKIRHLKCGNLGTVIGDIYEMETTNPLYQEVLEFCSNNENFVDIYADYRTEYTNDELEQAIAFIVEPRKSYMYRREVFKYNCTGCDRMEFRGECVNVGTVSKQCVDKDIFRLGEGVELLDCISPKLYELINLNNDYSRCFIKVYAGKENLLGYAFRPTDSLELIINVYEYTTCDVCGSKLGFFKDGCMTVNEMYYLYDDKLPSGIFKSEQFYYGQPINMVSSTLYKKMTKYVKGDNFIPVFKYEK